MLFAGLYFACSTHNPSAFVGLRTEASAVNVFLRLLYFSTSTMTSTGFGDITAGTLPTMMLCMAQQVVGMAFTAALCWVGLQFLSRPTSKDKPK